MIITLTITQSTDEIVSGIPKSVSITASISAPIFYTLDGSDPTTSSLIYTGPISIPTDQLTVNLNVFATDGVNSSPIIYNTYQTNLLGQDARFPHSGTTAQSNPPIGSLDPAPFGAPPIQPNQQFLGPAEAGLTVDNPTLPQASTGFDGKGNPTGFTNNQDTLGIPTPSFPYLYSDAGENGGPGTLPPSTVVRQAAPAERSNMNSPYFDPRALVVIQDSTQPTDPTLPVQINRMNFSLEDVEHVRDGNQLYNSGLDAPPVTGGLTRAHYNPVDNSMTYAYYDNTQMRWLFSRQPFQPKPSMIGDYSSGTVFSGGMGSGASRVYQWVPFKGSYLI